MTPPDKLEKRVGGGKREGGSAKKTPNEAKTPRLGPHMNPKNQKGPQKKTVVDAPGRLDLGKRENQTREKIFERDSYRRFASKRYVFSSSKFQGERLRGKGGGGGEGRTGRPKADRWGFVQNLFWGRGGGRRGNMREEKLKEKGLTSLLGGLVAIIKTGGTTIGAPLRREEEKSSN